MSCKHSDIIAIKSNGEKQYFCKLFKKRIENYECRNCVMKIEENNIDDLFGQIFGKGFGK